MKDAQLNPLQLAGSLARRDDFRKFVGYYSVPPRDVSVEEAAQWIREACGVESRRELLTNRIAAERFEHHVRRPFARWREQQEERSKRMAHA